MRTEKCQKESRSGIPPCPFRPGLGRKLWSIRRADGADCLRRRDRACASGLSGGFRRPRACTLRVAGPGPLPDTPKSGETALVFQAALGG
jgi:hypothetical protein